MELLCNITPSRCARVSFLSSTLDACKFLLLVFWGLSCSFRLLFSLPSFKHATWNIPFASDISPIQSSCNRAPPNIRTLRASLDYRSFKRPAVALVHPCARDATMKQTFSSLSIMSRRKSRTSISVTQTLGNAQGQR